MISSVSCVSSSTPASLRSDDPTGRLPAGAAGLKANLIRALTATVKGPRRGSQHPAYQRPRRPRRSGVSGQPPRFSPGNGRRRRTAPRLISKMQGPAVLPSVLAGRVLNSRPDQRTDAMPWLPARYATNPPPGSRQGNGMAELEVDGVGLQGDLLGCQIHA